MIGSLTGEAANRLENTKVTANNYDGAWKTLERRHDNKRVLLTAHMNNIISCKSADRKSVDEINRIVDVMEESRRAFRNLSCPVAHWDAWFVHHMVYKIDAVTRAEWEKSLGDSTDFAKFDDLVKFLENQTRELESAKATAYPAK